MILAFVVIYLLIDIGIGLWAARRVRNTNDFVVAGRRLPLIITASALFATWFGSETVMGASAEFVEHGVLGVIEDPFSASLCLLLIGIFFAAPMYRMNVYTFNDYFEQRYSPRVELVSALIMIPSYFGWIAGQLIAMSIILNVIAGVPLGWGLWLCAVIVVFYTCTGGMWAVSITDFIQAIIIIIGMMILAWVMVDKVGGLQKVIDSTPKGFFNFLPPNSWEKWSIYIAAWINIGLGSIPQQDIFQRVMAAKSERTAVNSAYLAAFMYLTVALLPLLIALCGKLLYPQLLHGGEDTRQMLLPRMVMEYGGTGLQILLMGALLSAIMSTASGAMLAPATVLGENIIRPRFKELTDKQLLLIMRLSVIFMAVCGLIMANINRNIYELASQASAISLVSLFVPLAFGIYWRRASALGAMLSILAGMAVWIYAEVMAFKTPSIFFGLGASVLGMLVGSFWRPQNPPTSQTQNQQNAQ
jgi:SSS family transporter